MVAKNNLSVEYTRFDDTHEEANERVDTDLQTRLDAEKQEKKRKSKTFASSRVSRGQVS